MTIIQSRIIKTAIFVLSVLLLIGAITGVIVIIDENNKPEIEDDAIMMSNEKYYMTELRPLFFANISIHENNYLQLSKDKKTGVIHFENASDIRFIVFQKNKIEFIRDGDNELVTLEMTETNYGYVFKNVIEYSVAITQQNPTPTEKISYNSTIMVFKKESK
ncbi:MAG: hypothetical protein LBH47_02410 [Christensenellaceae bacterium]|jgi:hypothetical protein|nr:hypothetical protein [Christensenellaceae bacterium]